MRLISLIFWSSIFLVGCAEETKLSTCEFTYFKRKNIEINSDIHRIIDGNGNVAKCIMKHDQPGIMDSIWYESIAVYYPKISETLKFGGDERNLLIYSAVGGTKAKKNSCHGYAKKGEMRFSDNRIISIDVELDFVGKENRRHFCKKQFGETLLHRTNKGTVNLSELR